MQTSQVRTRRDRFHRGNAFGGAGLPVLSQLKRKLQCDLPDTRISGAGNKSEATSRINRPIGILELGVIENVEEFSPKFKIHALVNRRVLVKSDVPIVQSGAVEKPSIGVAYLPNGLRGKRGGVKPLISRLPRIEDAHLFAGVVRAIGAFATTE